MKHIIIAATFFIVSAVTNTSAQSGGAKINIYNDRYDFDLTIKEKLAGNAVDCEISYTKTKLDEVISSQININQTMDGYYELKSYYSDGSSHSSSATISSRAAGGLNISTRYKAREATMLTSSMEFYRKDGEIIGHCRL